MRWFFYSGEQLGEMSVPELGGESPPLAQPGRRALVPLLTPQRHAAHLTRPRAYRDATGLPSPSRQQLYCDTGRSRHCRLVSMQHLSH